MDLGLITLVFRAIGVVFNIVLTIYSLYLAWRTYREANSIETELELILNQIRFFGYLILAVVMIGW